MNLTELKNRLIQEGYNDNQVTESTAERLLSLKGRAAEMLKRWYINGEKPFFEAVNGIDSSFLVEKLHMKDPALIIAYAMLEEDPEENSRYFIHLSNNIIGFYPTASSSNN